MNLIENVFSKLGTAKKVIRITSENPSLRGLLQEKSGKRAETLLQSARRQLYHIC